MGLGINISSVIYKGFLANDLEILILNKKNLRYNAFFFSKRGIHYNKLVILFFQIEME